MPQWMHCSELALMSFLQFGQMIAPSLFSLIQLFSKIVPVKLVSLDGRCFCDEHFIAAFVQGNTIKSISVHHPVTRWKLSLILSDTVDHGSWFYTEDGQPRDLKAPP